ncbi:hypothetical protein BS17DRAFT_880723 [Gyrodon lividus]|nr:hypothetical protein BS17DRAFT_880723 [Gyrodon lividus]
MSTKTQADLQMHKNVLMLTVDNLLSSWPMYIIDFTPKQPGPMKLILCLKDTSDYVDDDSDGLDGRKASKVPGVALDQDEAYRIITKLTNAIPVELHGICKGQKLANHKIFNDNSEDNAPWLPICPRAFHQVGTNVATSSIHMIKTNPAHVKVTSTGKENGHI